MKNTLQTRDKNISIKGIYGNKRQKIVEKHPTDDMQDIVKCWVCDEEIVYGTSTRMFSGYEGCDTQIIVDGKFTTCYDDLSDRIAWTKEFDPDSYSKKIFKHNDKESLLDDIKELADDNIRAYCVLNLVIIDSSTVLFDDAVKMVKILKENQIKGDLISLFYYDYTQENIEIFRKLILTEDKESFKLIKAYNVNTQTIIDASKKRFKKD